MRVIRTAPVGILPCDKEPGFCMVPKDHLEMMHEKMLGGPIYKEVAKNVSEDRLLLRGYASLCKRIATAEASPRLQMALLKSANRASASLHATLRLLI